MREIRRLELGEGTLYRKVRLESLLDSPESFSSTYDDAIARDEQSWNDQADSSATGEDRATFVLFDDERPRGLAAIYREVEGVGELIQMWVAPEMRDGDAAHDLVVSIFEWARMNRFSRIKAEVILSNSRALRFYRKLGFAESEDGSQHSDSSVVLSKELGM